MAAEAIQTKLRVADGPRNKDFFSSLSPQGSLQFVHLERGIVRYRLKRTKREVNAWNGLVRSDDMPTGATRLKGRDPSLKLCPLFPREKVDGTRTRLAFAVTVTRCPPRYPDLSCLDHVFSGCSIAEDKGRITWSPGAREKGN